MLKVGDTVNGRWNIIEPLSKASGQSITFKVAERLKPDGSIRVLKLLNSVNEQSVARFRLEIEASFSLEHDNIVHAEDSQYESTKTPYLVTSYYQGGELNKHAIEGLTLVERLQMFESICSAVAYAHEKGVIHRDLKPANIFLTDRKSKIPVVGDFGLCFFVTDDSDGEAEERLTAVREQVGAKNFRPPEADVGLVDDMQPSFDVYSLGKLLYWFVSNGRFVIREYYGREHHDLRLEDENQSIHVIYDIFAKTICENPSDRYLNAGELLQEIKSLIKFVKHEARYLNCLIPQPCVFCRNGFYEFATAPHVGPNGYSYNVSRRYGIEILDSDGRSRHGTNQRYSTYLGVLIGKCTTCGNVQQFNMDFKLDEESLKYIADTKWKSLPDPSEY